MHYEKTNLPADVHEVFFSDVYFYASSSERTLRGRPRFVGCGATREAALHDLRRAAAAHGTAPPEPEPVEEIDGVVTLEQAMRQALGHNLARLRVARGLSQLQVARQALGFEKSHAAISRLERGVQDRANRDQLERLALFYATTVVALLRD